MSNFDWLDYDESPIFKQGIAIVRRYGKFGAVMVGGKEIVPPIYDDLSEFKDGFAVAKWNNEERVVNLSGQVQVFKDNKEIFLPEEYDWGFDFIEDICVVVKDDKYGIIDFNFNVKHDCEYDSFTNYHNGYAIFSKDRWSESPINVYNEYEVWSDDFLIDNKGKVSYKIKESFTDGHKIVCGVGDQQKLYGVMDSNMQLIIPVAYPQMNRLKNGFYVGDSKEDTKLFIHPENGNIISEKVADYITDLNENFFCTYRRDKTKNKSETCIYSSPESLLISFPSQVFVESDRDGCVIFEYNNNKFKYDSKSNLYIISKRYVPYPGYWETNVVRKVKKEYLNFVHKPFPITSQIKQYEIIENEKRQKGISDLEGNIMIEPQYNDINFFTGNLFIVSTDINRKFGIVDISNSIKIPFDFNSLIKINDKFLAYTDTTGSSVQILPSYKSTSYYLNTYFGIIDVNGNKITKPLFSSITIENSSSTFIVGVGTKYGVVNTKGQCILRCEYDTINYNEHTRNFTFNISHKNKTGTVSVDGFHIVKDAQENIIKVPTDIVDWCGDFGENNIADVIKYGYLGHINKLYQFVSLVDGKELIMPSKYDYILDFTCGNAPILLGSKYGIVNTKFELIIPCEYEYIEALSDDLFKFREGGKWGIINKSKKLIVGAEYLSISYETESLLMVETRVQNGSSTEPRYGLLDCQGNVVVSAECKTITRAEQGNDIFFIVEKNLRKGVIDKNGNIIVPFIYNYISDGGTPFYCVYHNSYDINDKKFHSFYKSNGERFICIDIDQDCSQKVTIPAGYEYAAYVGYGIVKVSQIGRWGLIDILGNIIIEPQYSFIDIFDGSFAKVGKCVDEEKYQYGLIDTSGEVVLPIEYNKIEKWDNGYYIIQKNGLYGLLSPTLHVVIVPSKNYLKVLDEKYILVKCYGNNSNWGLIDYFGNEVIPADGGYYSFSKIEVLENGFLKVIYHRAGYKHRNQFRIGILDSKGKELYNNDECEDITYLGNGLLLVNHFLYTTYDGAGHNTFNIVNLRGKELFYSYYDSIEILKNGNFLILKNSCYGMAKNTGEIYIPPKYTNRIEFENGVAKIKVQGSVQEHYIDTNGQAIVLDSNKNKIKIPKKYYWGTDFINRISIVRATTYPYYSNDVVGVINETGEVVIPAKYDNIKLLSDNTLLVNNGDSYGLFEMTGKCILPDIFTSIDYVSKERIRVIWNLNKTQSWSPGEHTPSLSKDLGTGANYLVDTRSALCDTKGYIINDKNFVFIGKFRNGYACCCLNLEVEGNKVKLKQVGIIDINGTTVVNPEYDSIILYNHSYARLRKGKLYGIADLKNKRTIVFSEINITKPGAVDSFGRFIYTDGDCNNQTNNKGVLGLKGIILPSGKFSYIELLENGLIKVSNNGKTLYGLLSLDGKELLKMEYSYISAFKYGYAAICIGGHKEDEFPYKHVGGKWGIIDKTGKFIINCIHDEEQRFSAEEVIKYNLIDDSDFDSFGRMLFYEWKEVNRCHIGVIGINGIIVPIGKYPNIQLLENGLIKVSNEEETFDSLGGLYGLLDAEGKELLEMKYSYISEFKNGHASICIGGYNTHLMQNTHVGGKWGIIDITGKIVVECIHDEEQQLTIENIVEKYLIDEYGNKILQVLCSDYIPVNTSNNIDTCYSDVYDDYED